MNTFELNIFIDCRRDKVYDHLSEPINMIGLRPLLTEIDVLKEKKDAQGITLRPYNSVETFKWLGLPIYRSQIYSVIHLTKPRDAMEVHMYGKPNTEIVFKYVFKQFNDGKTQITQTVEFVKVNRLLGAFVVNQSKQTQLALLSNLKVRLEKH